MKTIYELWDEIKKHPDYVTGSFWTVEDVASNIEFVVEEYMDEKYNPEENLQLIPFEIPHSYFLN